MFPLPLRSEPQEVRATSKRKTPGRTSADRSSWRTAAARHRRSVAWRCRFRPAIAPERQTVAVPVGLPGPVFPDDPVSQVRCILQSMVLVIGFRPAPAGHDAFAFRFEASIRAKDDPQPVPRVRMFPARGKQSKGIFFRNGLPFEE